MPSKTGRFIPDSRTTLRSFLPRWRLRISQYWLRGRRSHDRLRDRGRSHDRLRGRRGSNRLRGRRSVRRERSGDLRNRITRSRSSCRIC
jgi:hypothetical protein